MVVEKHGIQTFIVVVVVLLLLLLSVDVFVPVLSAHPLLLFNKWLVQIYSKCQILGIFTNFQEFSVNRTNSEPT